MKITGAVLEEIGRPRPFAESRPVTISELELGKPGPTEILVRLEAAGICHSDLSVVDGNRVRPVPMLLGHEAAGRVLEVGSDVSDIQAGQRVVMSFLPRCEECDNCAEDGRLPCTAGSKTNGEGVLLHGSAHLSRGGERVFHHLGVSGFATHAVVDRASAVPVGDDVPPDIAAVLGCAVLTGGGAVLNAARPKPEDSIMIVGLGGVGMAALITAISQNVSRIVAVDTLEEKLEHARRLGAHETFTPQQALEQGIKAKYVIECAGNPRAFETAFAATAVGGTTITAGLPSPDARAQIPPMTITAEARTIIGSYLGSAVPARDIPKYAQLWREGRLPVEELITTRIGLSDINQAMDQLADGKAVRQVIMFDTDHERTS
ncbi:alcohol dehydrogenase catalytic domain-containing protein [Arthrobacter sp. FW306-05-C]|uniref:Alcohol dehydrogenase n=1 Tax=Pseudarthrobacter enclensis TaxID=993070 RepID=A0ABT9RU08_9MICC|nr:MULTISPECIES: alcohol dehydrogenase catalytic domain-containing protein [Micrococcaceae]MDP9888724.1 alcohol dehydrogenase [Pseudarthrobacter enclensis]UKA66548.1 alcohol dehydrogenase catalytic domain-containing protein [Arthrobacter sp. FW306-05-C]